MVKFFTQEMSDQSEKMMKTDPEVKAKLAGVTLKFILLVTDCPDNEDREMKLGFDNGELVENALTVKPAPSDLRTEPLDTSKYAAKVAGPYEVMVQVSTKKLPMLAALGSMRIEGDMTALITNMAGLTNLLDIFGTMPELEF
ncbi:MAG: hypothetical protein U9N44_05220 [Chloroflexota bacterium]|nr:hypothetical protein [Chloroflexota bacterium]